MVKIQKYNNIDWSMPFLFSNDLFLPVLYDLIGEKHQIKYVYGAPQCLWAGGRISKCRINNIKLIERIFENIKLFNSIPVLTFTNTSLKETDTNDKYCNELLRILSDFEGQVIIASDKLYTHIKTFFPKIKIVSSIIQSTYQKIKDINETEYINSLLDRYDRVVIRPEFVINKDYNFSDIKNISKLELLINQNCTANCPASDIHYRLIELFDKELITNEGMSRCLKKICPRQINTSTKTNSLSDIQISKCIKAGITNLKLQGRNFSFDGIEKELFKYYFKNNCNKKEIRKKIDEIVARKVKFSLELQLHSFLTKN